jgi:hypothetical protein
VVADLGGELVKVPHPDGMQPVGDTMQRRVRRGIVLGAAFAPLAWDQ